MECTKPQPEQVTSQAISAKSAKNEGITKLDHDLHRLMKTLPRTVHQEVFGVLGPMTVNIVVNKAVFHENTMELNITRRIQLSPTLPEVKETATLKASVSLQRYGSKPANSSIYI